MAFLDAKLIVLDGGTVVLVAVHLSQPATVSPQAVMHITAGSIAEASGSSVDALKIPASAGGR